jgi:hypothetical protein
MKGIVEHWPEIAIATVIAIMVGAAIADPQESVVINTGHSSKAYQPGEHRSSAIIPPKGTNKVVSVFDVTKHNDPAVCVEVGMERSVNFGVDWQHHFSSVRCGRADGFKDKAGNNMSAVTSSATRENGNYDGEVLRSFMRIQGGAVQTSTAVTMADIQ